MAAGRADLDLAAVDRVDGDEVAAGDQFGGAHPGRHGLAEVGSLRRTGPPLDGARLRAAGYAVRVAVAPLVRVPVVRVHG